MEATATVDTELKALTETVKGYQKQILDLERQVQEAKAAGQGSAEIKGQIEKVIGDHAEAVKALHERIDESEVKMKERIGAGGYASDSGFGDFRKAFDASGLNSGRQGRVRHTFDVKAVTPITNTQATGGDLLVPQYSPGIIRPGEAALTTLDLVPTIRTSASSIIYMREEAVTDGVAIQTTQGAKKGETSFTFEKETANVETIAHYTKAAKQMLDDAVGLDGYVRSRMLYLLRYKLSGEILTGDGTTGHLDGINENATAYDDANEASVTSPQRIDRLRLAIEQVFESEFPATGIVLSPLDWALIELAKDGENRYLFTNPVAGGPPRLWGLPVASDRQQASGVFTVGNFTPAALHLWVREEASVMVSSENEDDFIKNLVTILAEMRAALTIYRPSAFVTGPLVTAATT